MPWGDVPVDAHFFSMFTKGHVLVMGRKTYDSLPTKSLKDRTIIVIRRKVDPFLNVDSVIQCTTIDEAHQMALNLSAMYGNTRYFVAGGQSIYERYADTNLCNDAILTHLDQEYDADRYLVLPDDFHQCAVIEHNKFIIRQYRRLY